MPTVLMTGFGPFPGAPFNPTTPLVQKLARLRRSSLLNVTVVPHIFATSYDAVDRDLPELIAKHRPDALLMFGLATRATTMRVELRARNALSSSPDVNAQLPGRHVITLDATDALPMPVPARQLMNAVRAAKVPVKLSYDAGSYLCNYLCWQAVEATQWPHGPRLAAFIHVPLVARFSRSATAKRHFTLADLVRAGERLLVAVAAAVRR
jgi:pyroglutamyl-peptidase